MNCEQEGWDEYSLEVEDESIGDQPVTFSGIKRSHFKTFIIRFKGTLTSFFLGGWCCHVVCDDFSNTKKRISC